MDYSESDYIRAADAKGRGLTRMSVLFCCSIKSAGIWEIQERSGTEVVWNGAARKGTEPWIQTRRRKKWKELGNRCPCLILRARFLQAVGVWCFIEPSRIAPGGVSVLQ